MSEDKDQKADETTMAEMKSQMANGKKKQAFRDFLANKTHQDAFVNAGLRDKPEKAAKKEGK